MARQVLENGVILPAEYSDDWYDDMTSNLTKLDDVIGSDSEKLSSADVGKFLENASAIGRPISVATKDRLAANGLDKDLSDYYLLADLVLTVADDFDTVSQGAVYQMMLGCRPDDHEAILRGTAGAKIAVSWERAVDVIPVSSGKGAAITKILKYFNLNASDAMAFGNSYNDIEILQTVGTGVAMGKAAAWIKEIADDTCGSVSEDGIYHYCIDHGLICPKNRDLITEACI